MPLRSPNRLEKRSQTARLLASKAFKRHPKLSEFLQFLVECEISGIAVDERLVGVRVYGRGESWITTDDSCVRDGLSRLKKLLDAYYASLGIEDRLNLELDRYKAIFSYNLRHPVEREFRLAARYVGSDPKAAFKHLSAVLSFEPNHAEAHAAWAETEMWRAFYGYDMGLPEFLATTELRVSQALKMDRECWRAHVVSGALHCGRHRWQKAKAAFEAALHSSREQTLAHPWYAAYLMAIGQRDEALHLAKARAGEPSDSPWPQLAYAIFLYAGRHFAEAQEVIRQATVEEHQKRFFDLVSYFSLFAENEIPSVHDRLYLGAMTSLQPETEGLWYPVFGLLRLIFMLDPEEPAYELIKETLIDVGRAQLARWTRPIDADEAERTGPHLSPFQLAIGYLAIGEPDHAIDHLQRDVSAGHPILAWLHLWPVFDELRELPRFQALIAQMNLPPRMKSR